MVLIATYHIRASEDTKEISFRILDMQSIMILLVIFKLQMEFTRVRINCTYNTRTIQVQTKWWDIAMSLPVSCLLHSTHFSLSQPRSAYSQNKENRVLGSKSCPPPLCYSSDEIPIYVILWWTGLSISIIWPYELLSFSFLLLLFLEIGPAWSSWSSNS